VGRCYFWKNRITFDRDNVKRVDSPTITVDRVAWPYVYYRVGSERDKVCIGRWMTEAAGNRLRAVASHVPTPTDPPASVAEARAA
jgi:hypothetical protein